MKAALGQVVSQGRVARGGGEGNRGTGGKRDSAEDGAARVATRSCHGGSRHHRHSPEPGSTLPHHPRTRGAQADELQFGTCKPAETRAEEEEGARDAEQAKRVRTRTRERRPSTSELLSLLEQMP